VQFRLVGDSVDAGPCLTLVCVVVPQDHGEHCHVCTGEGFVARRRGEELEFVDAL